LVQAGERNGIVGTHVGVVGLEANRHREVIGGLGEIASGRQQVTQIPLRTG
jgi:hypothetical protein